MIRAALALPIAATLLGCAPAPEPEGPVPSGPPPTWAGLGETVYVAGPKVTPLEVLEDSRCPAGTQCVWAGTVRIRVTVHLGSGDRTHELELGKAIHVSDGVLELLAVRPETSEAAIPRGDYRFGLRFMGGL